MRARDYNTNWITGVAILDEDTYLAAENSYNLFTVAKNSDAAADEERNHLEVKMLRPQPHQIRAPLTPCAWQTAPRFAEVLEYRAAEDGERTQLEEGLCPH